MFKTTSDVEAAVERPLVGILGGMGPVASAEFLKTIYQQHTAVHEQEAVPVILLSDPSFPDRTDAFLSGREDDALQRLVAALCQLRQLGATTFVLCCMTIHHLVPRLPPDLRARVISVIDLLIAELRAASGSHLILCSRGTRALRLLQSHPNWHDVCQRAVFPDSSDQDVVHDTLIQGIKRNGDLRAIAKRLEMMLPKYRADSFIVACSEIHVLAKQWGAARDGRQACVDPFMAIARRIHLEHDACRPPCR